MYFKGGGYILSKMCNKEVYFKGERMGARHSK